MSLSLMLAFWAVSLLMVVTPGADWAYTISAGIRHRSPIPAVSGLMVGYLIAGAVVAAGVGAVVMSTPSVLSVLTVIGACYLVWLGIGALRSEAQPAGSAEGGMISARSQVLKGVGTSGLNPKMMLLFLAVLPQFTLAGSAVPVGAQMMALVLLHVTSATAIYLLLGYASRSVLATRPQIARWVSRFSGVAMLAIGSVLLAREVLG